MTAASSFPHASSPAVHPHEPGHHLTTALAGALVFVLRLLPCRARGVTCSAGYVTSPAETQPFLGVSSLTLRADLAGSARTFGSLLFQTAAAVVPILMTGCR